MQNPAQQLQGHHPTPPPVMTVVCAGRTFLLTVRTYRNSREREQKSSFFDTVVCVKCDYCIAASYYNLLISAVTTVNTKGLVVFICNLHIVVAEKKKHVFRIRLTRYLAESTGTQW